MSDSNNCHLIIPLLPQRTKEGTLILKRKQHLVLIIFLCVQEPPGLSCEHAGAKSGLDCGRLRPGDVPGKLHLAGSQGEQESPVRKCFIHNFCNVDCLTGIVSVPLGRWGWQRDILRVSGPTNISKPTHKGIKIILKICFSSIDFKLLAKYLVSSGKLWRFNFQSVILNVGSSGSELIKEAHKPQLYFDDTHPWKLYLQ